MELYFSAIDTPIGKLEVVSSKHAIRALHFSVSAHAPSLWVPDVMRQCLEQLEQYFRGNLKVFDVNTEQSGTDFQKLVWKKVSEIPYGETLSYREVATRCGNAGAVRAVGHANGRNRVPVIIPCHRVVGADESLVGYAGGLWRKRWLLDHERSVSFGVRKLF